MKKIVEYDSKMNDLSFGKFKEKELDLFFSICYKMKNEGVNEVTLTFQELKELSNYSNRNLDRFIKDLQNVYKKLLNITMEFETEKEIIGFVLFTDYRVTKEERTVSIRVNDRYSYILNDIVKFTKFDLIEFSNLKSSYARNMFRLLKQFDSKELKECWYQIKLDKFKVMLDIPSSYQMGSIDQKVLSPILEQLAPYFNGLKLEKIKRGVKVDSLKFTWKEKKKKQIEQGPAIKKKSSIGEKELKEYQEQFQEREQENNSMDQVEKVDKIKISKADHKKLYEKHLEEIGATHNPFIEKAFNIASKSKYEVIEFQEQEYIQTKIYTVEDIDESLLVSKNGRKLTGMARHHKINKILEEMNKNGSV